MRGSIRGAEGDGESAKGPPVRLDLDGCGV